MKEKVLFEVCCGCFVEDVQAEKGGAERIELNSALFLVGLTPSIGTVQAVKNTLKIPVMCMVRPREGGFCYTDFDYMTCCRDMEALLNAGADGIVFGFLKPDGTVDTDRCADFIGKIKKINPNAEIVFHRAIDVVPDVFKALDDLISRYSARRRHQHAERRGIYQRDRRAQCTRLGALPAARHKRLRQPGDLFRRQIERRGYPGERI